MFVYIWTHTYSCTECHASSKIPSFIHSFIHSFLSFNWAPFVVRLSAADESKRRQCSTCRGCGQASNLQRHGVVGAPQAVQRPHGRHSGDQPRIHLKGVP